MNADERRRGMRSAWCGWLLLAIAGGCWAGDAPAKREPTIPNLLSKPCVRIEVLIDGESEVHVVDDAGSWCVLLPAFNRITNLDSAWCALEHGYDTGDYVWHFAGQGPRRIPVLREMHKRFGG
jgi:hypothetical protein